MMILILISGLGLGGAERHVVDLALQLRNAGESVVVGYFIPHKNDLAPELEAAGIRCAQIRRGTFGLIHLLDEIAPSVVHAHLTLAVCYARAARLLRDFRLVTTYHNLMQRRRWSARVFEIITRRLDDAAVSCSSAVAKSWPWPTRVVSNGIPPEIRPSSVSLRSRIEASESDLVVVSIANLSRKKNHKMMVDAFNLMSPSCQPGTRFFLVLIGQHGTEYGRLQEIARRTPRDRSVVFWGPDINAATLLGEANLFCLSSKFEGLPIALLESMRAGIPALVTDVGEMPSLVENGASGLVVPSCDVGQMANAFTELLSHPNKLTEMGLVARHRFMEGFDAKLMSDKLRGIYK